MTEPTPPIVETPPVSEPPETPAPKEPSRVGRFLRRALRWVVGGMLIFLLGLVATWFAQVQPKAAQIEALRAELDAAQAELETLRPLADENERLEAEADRSRARLAVVEALVDITSARVAVFMDDAVAARSYLSGTGDRLTVISSRMGPSVADEIEEMRGRLDQILGELGDDTFAAQRDLEVLANSLATLAAELPAP